LQDLDLQKQRRGQASCCWYSWSVRYLKLNERSEAKRDQFQANKYKDG
jgi:hypothetical protein